MICVDKCLHAFMCAKYCCTVHLIYEQLCVYAYIVAHSAQAHTNKSLEERERPRLALLQLNTFTNLIISVCAGPERFLAFSFSNVITCPTPPPAITPRSKGVGQPCIPTRGGGAGPQAS